MLDFTVGCRHTGSMDIRASLENAVKEGKLLATAAENMRLWMEADFLPEWALNALRELVAADAWAELNERFYQTLKFGTGGLRGRTIGRTTPPSEQGASPAGAAPEHPAVGSNTLNDFNIIRSTMGLYRYCETYLRDNDTYDVPKLVVAYDVRHFSRHFCELAASTWTRMGGLALIFSGPRPTPHLSFSVRYLRCTAGIVITASHNPPHDNGYKAYFADGAQVVSPQAEAIIEEVGKVALKDIPAYFDKDLTKVITLPESVDQAYLEVQEENVLDHELLEAHSPRIVFSPVHGTSAVTVVPLLQAFGVDVHPVEEQMLQDPDFSTVKSPNPEMPEAFTLALRLADKVAAEAVVATDPDGDRLGVGARGRDGRIRLFTGNQLGACLAEYRIRKLKDMEVLPEAGSRNAALIKTFVTTPLQEAIATGHGLKCINTLTGFKWIGEKLKHYQELLEDKLFQEEGIALDYDATDLSTRVSLLQEYSTYYVFGGEESYGYLASDVVRDKDATAAVIMFCELLAYLKSVNLTLAEYLDQIYLQYGYHAEKLANVYMEGASGAERIAAIIQSYRAHPPRLMGGHPVTRITDFAKDTLQDADGKPIPREDFFLIELEGGYQYAVRGSGTEPKIKFYGFIRRQAVSAEQLEMVKGSADSDLQALLQAITEDANKRAGLAP